MTLGILEPPSDPKPPGTSLLRGVHSDGSSTDLILVPQPSNFPSDPLNFSRLRKELLFATLILGACATGVIGPVLVPGFNIIAAEFHFTSLTKITLLNGALVMALGVSSYLCNCLSVVYGKRILYIVTSVILLVASTWAAESQSYGSLLGARIVQGLGMGTFFAMAGTSSINDVFFVHQRGLRVGLWNMAVIVSVNLTPIISAQVIIELSWRWTFWLLAITYGTVLICSIFLLPETTFERPKAAPDVVMSKQSIESGNMVVDDKKSVLQNPEAPESPGIGSVENSRFGHRLGLGAFRIRDQKRVPALLVAPFKTLLHPIVLWSCAMWSVVFTWVIIQGAVAAQIFQAPPYSMSAVGVGNLVGVAPMIGSALGTIIGGRLSDDIVKFMAVRNQGVYEPEYRLVVMIPFLITMIIGGFGLGLAINNGLSAVTCGVFLAFVNFAVGVGCTGIVAYSNDACQNKPGEVFGIAMLVKSAFAFGLTFMLNEYYTNHGPKVFFFTWTALTVGVSMFTIPMYIYGKQMRSFANRNGIIV